MEYYFGLESKSRLQFFGPIHLCLLLGTILIIYLIYKNKEKIKKIKNIDKMMVFILLSNMIIYSLGGIFLGEFDINFHIPIQYCYITGFIFMYMLLTKKEKIYNFLYYSIIFCTSTVLIFQDPTVTYDRYHFILMIISHHFLLICNFYVFYVLNYNVNKKGIKYFCIYSITLYSIVYVINLILNTTYIFKDSFPRFMYEYFPFIDVIPPLAWFAIYSIPLMCFSYFLILKRENLKIK